MAQNQQRPIGKLSPHALKSGGLGQRFFRTGQAITLAGVKPEQEVQPVGQIFLPVIVDLGQIHKQGLAKARSQGVALN
ncbi:MAG: hypothetical protein DWQ01_13955 [Planctomycetota bacterium]|nr:MAG: hypothetical protein DWQ01_13955 [Planctomycetota bacterium]